MFETYGFESAMCNESGPMILYGNGLLTGVAVDLGAELCRIDPIYEGYIMQREQKILHFGGIDVTKHMITSLCNNGYGNFVNSKTNLEAMNKIKESVCYVATDLDVERRLAIETTSLIESVELPDGNIIKIGKERFEAAEALFDPLNTANIDGIYYLCIIDVYFNHIYNIYYTPYKYYTHRAWNTYSNI